MCGEPLPAAGLELVPVADDLSLSALILPPVVLWLMLAWGFLSAACAHGTCCTIHGWTADFSLSSTLSHLHQNLASHSDFLGLMRDDKASQTFIRALFPLMKTFLISFLGFGSWSIIYFFLLAALSPLFKSWLLNALY